MMGCRAGRICWLLHLFADPVELFTQEQDEDYRKSLSKTCGPIEPAGEPQYQELLRLLDEEIAHVQEEFEYAQKVNEEKAAIERDACLAPIGEDWSTMVRQQAALDRSIDRKVRILLSLRKQLPTGDLPALPTDQGGDAETEETNRILEMGIPSGTPPTEGRVTSKNERTMRECL
jgi:hypothetical protein